MAPSFSSTARVRSTERVQAITPAGLTGLGNRFVELLGRRLTRRNFAAEMARLISEALRCRAVAVLAYDGRHQRLSLLADKGLRPDSRAALGDGQECTWDIPMRGLRNRRISVVEAAHQNPFVPASLSSLSPAALCIACLPVYSDQEPIGVVLVFATGARAFPDTQLQTLSQALRTCARGLRDTGPPGRAAAEEDELATTDVREQAGAAANALDGEVPPRTSAEAQPVPSQTAQPPDLVARVQHLEQELLRAQTEVERNTNLVQTLTSAGHALARERDALRQQVADLQRERATEDTELRGQVTALEDRLLAAESERARYQRAAEVRHTTIQQALANSQAEHESLREQLRAADARAAAAQAVAEAARNERDELGAQTARLTAQVRADEEALQRAQAHYADERAGIEADRDGWKEQATALRGELAAQVENVLTLDRDLRSTIVARDTSATQLQAARAELDRLTALTDELSAATTQVEAARAGAIAEAAALRRTLEDDRAKHLKAEQALRVDLAAVHGEADRLSAAISTLREELAARARVLAEREQQLTDLRAEQLLSRQAQSATQQATEALHAEVATLTARLQQTAAERQELLDERAALRAALAEARQRANQADVAHAAAVGELQAQATDLRQQLATASHEHGNLTERLRHTQNEGQTLSRRLAVMQRRAEDLAQLLTQRDAERVAAANDRDGLVAQVTTLTGQVQARDAALERAQADHAQYLVALDAERHEWQAQRATLEGELAQQFERTAASERERERVIAAHDALAEDRDGARTQLNRLTELNTELERSRAELQDAKAAAESESAVLRETLAAERAAHAEAEGRAHADLTTARTEIGRLSEGAAVLKHELETRGQMLAARDEQLAALQTEVVQLQQRGADREALAQQSAALHATTGELEQSLAAARVEAARLEDDRRALAEDLHTANERVAEVTAAAAREHAALQGNIDELVRQRARLEADQVARDTEIAALRTTVADLEAARERVQSERASFEQQARENAQQARDNAVRAAAAERQLAEACSASDQRAGVIESLTADRDRLTAQLEILTAEATAVRHTLEAERTQRGATLAVLQGELAEVTSISERRAAEIAGLGSALAERDAQVAALGEAQEAARAAARHAQAEWQQGTAALEAQIAGLSARLTSSEAERQQAREDRAALEHQLASITATHEAHQQALTRARQDAERRLAELDEERGTLQRLLAETRQQATESETAHAALVSQLAERETQLRHQVSDLTADRSTLTARLEESERALALQTQRVDDESHRVATLAEQCAQLKEALVSTDSRYAGADRELLQTRNEVAALQAVAEERATELAALRSELSRVKAARTEEEHAFAEELRAARHSLAELKQQRNALRATLADVQQRGGEAETAHATHIAQLQHDAAELRQQLEAAAGVAARCTDLEHALAAAEARSVAADREVIDARNDAAALQALIAQRAAERDQFQDRLRDVENELSRVQEARSKQTQAFTKQLRTTRQTLVGLEQERDALRATLADMQERGGRAETAHVTRISQLEQHAADLRAQCTRLEEALTAADARAVAADRELAAARGEAATLEALVTERSAEHDRLANELAALGSQLSRVEESRATQADALAEQLRTAHHALEGLEQERDTLRATLSELQGRGGEAETAHAARMVELEQHAAELAGQCTQLTQALAAADARCAAADREVAETRGQAAALQAGVDERATEAARLRDDLKVLEGELAAASEARTAEQRAFNEERSTHRHALLALEQERTDLQSQCSTLQQAAQEATTVHATESARLHEQGTELRRQLDALTADAEALRQDRARAEAELARQTRQAADEAERSATLAQQTAELETRLRAEEAQRTTVDDELARARHELDALRQHSADRGELARRAAALQSQVSDLEQQVARMRGAAQTETERHTRLLQELQDALQRQTEATHAAEQERVQLAATIGQLTGERDRLTTEIGDWVRELDTEHATVARLEQTIAQLREDRARAHAEGQDAAQRVAELHRKMEELSGLLQQRDAAIATAAADRQRLGAQIAQLTAKVRATEETFESTRGREALERAALEADRDTWKAEATARSTELERLAAEVEELQHVTRQHETLRAATTTETAALREALESERRRAHESEQAQQAALASLRADLERQAAEAEALRAAAAEREEQLAALRHDQSITREAEMAAQQTAAMLQAELTVMRGQLAERTSECQEIAAARSDLEHQLAVMTTTRSEREQALDRALQARDEQTQRAEAEAAALQNRLDVLNASQTDLAERLQRAEQAAAVAGERADAEAKRAAQFAERCADLEQSSTAAETDRAAAGKALEQARAEIEALRQQAADRDALAARAADLAGRLAGREQQLADEHPQGAAPPEDLPPYQPQSEAAELDLLPEAEVSEELAPQNTPLVIERSAPLGTVIDAIAEPEPEPAAPPVERPGKAAGPRGELVLVDPGPRRDEACEALKAAGFEVTVAAPDDAGLDDLAKRKIKCLMLNVASGPRPWFVLRALRERAATRKTPILAYAMPPDARAGFSFGRTDFAVWPLEAPRLIEYLGRLRPKLRRLMALTADIDGMGKMRAPLADAGISTSIMLDGKQALEFATIVEPEAAILHLSPACPTATRTLVAFRAADATRNLPLLVLLDHTAAPGEDTFFGAAVRQLLTKPNFQFANLPEEIARVMEG